MNYLELSYLAAILVRFMVRMAVFFRTLFCASCLLVIAGCDGDDGPEDDFGNNTGIKGRVLVQNEFTQPLYDDREGINVTLNVGFNDFSVAASSVGNWQLAGAPVGTYTITYSKAGFSTVIIDSILVSTVNPQYAVDNGFQKLPTVSITRLPTTEFNNFMLDLSFTVQGS